MVSINNFRKLAISFEAASELPHFEKTSFRVNKKIFATLDETKSRAVVKFTTEEQPVFCLYDNTIIYPVPGKWGLQGWTMIELQKIKTAMLKDIVTTSYRAVAPKKLAEKYKQP